MASIVLLVVCSTVAGALAVFGTMYSLNYSAVDATSYAIQYQTAQNILRSTQQYNSPRVFAVQIMAEYLRVQTIANSSFLKDPKRWLPVAMSLSQQFVSSFVGFPDGSVYGYRQYAYPPPSGLLTALAYFETNNQSQFVTYLTDTIGQPTGSPLSIANNYNSTQRVWYTEAVIQGGFAWSPLFVFAGVFPGSDQIGVSLSCPIFQDLKRPIFFASTDAPSITDPNDVSTPTTPNPNRTVIGVTGVTISLEYISSLLVQTKLGVSGKGLAWYFDQTGATIAVSDPTVTYHNASTIVQIDKINNPIIQETMTRLLQKTTTPATPYAGIPIFYGHTWTIQGVQYLVSVVPYNISGVELQWTLVLLSPFEDYFGMVHYANVVSLIVMFCCILPLLAVVTALLSLRLVSRPTRELAELMESITHNLEFRKRSMDDSLVTEVRTMQLSYDAMENALRSFSKFAHTETVRTILKTNTEAAVGVADAKATVMFSDIVGFTSIAEKVDPKQLVVVLEDYFSAMTEIIQRYEGTVGDLIGDAIFAFWNVPIHTGPRHAFLAIEAAVEQQHCLQQLRQDWRSRGLPEIYTRIGIHTGPVLAGNVGSRTRLKYTLIGDTVNLASRLESLCKVYGTNIIVSEDVWNAHGVQEAFCGQVVDYVSVVGRQNPTMLVAILTSRFHATPIELAIERLSKDAMDQLCDGNFAEACRILNDLMEIAPQNRAAQKLLERSTQLKRILGDMVMDKAKWTPPVNKLEEK